MSNDYPLHPRYLKRSLTMREFLKPVNTPDEDELGLLTAIRDKKAEKEEAWREWEAKQANL